MKTYRHFLSTLVWTTLLLPAVSSAQFPWTGIIAPARATSNWSSAGLANNGGAIDIPPDASWTQCGSTIAAYGSSGSYASASTIQSAINACGTDQYVLLGPGTFYISPNITLKSNMELRGTGANQTFLYFNSSIASPGCNGPWGGVCITGSNTYAGNCTYNSLTPWNCFPGTTPGFGYSNSNTANWTAGYAQGAMTITLSNVAGIVPNLTPIVLDQCDTGLTGSLGVEGCYGGTAGAITAATIDAGGSGYSVGDTGTIICTPNWGDCFGADNATYQVTAVSGGAVTAFTISNPGNAYDVTTVSTGQNPAPTAATTGDGSGLTLNITGVSGYDNGAFFVCSITAICEDEGPSNTARPARSQQEVVIATAITGSGPYTLTLSHPLMHPDWASGQSPQAWWGTSTITNAGVENLWMTPAGGIASSCVVINTAYNVWVQGVACSTANFFHVDAYIASNILIRDSYFYWTRYAGTTSYGAGSAGQIAAELIENNIVQGVVDPFSISGGCTGCVIAYNFAVNNYDNSTANLFPSNTMHTAGTDYILEEGNIGAAMNLDTIHGAHLANTFFRNYFTGYESNNGTLPTQQTIPMVNGALSRYNNFLGNVLGTPGFHTTYQCNPTSATLVKCPLTNWAYIWDLGWSHAPSLFDYNNIPGEPNDVPTIGTIYRYGNYDVVNNSVQWNSSEVPTSDPNFPNPIPGSNTFPPSFYNSVAAAHSSCGTGLPFWRNPSTGTCPPYPSIGPDVSNGDIGMCTSGTYQWARALSSSQCAGGSFQAGPGTDGGYGNSNPAMRCYLNQMSGPPDGTGSMLTFNPASCYAPDSSGPAIQPSPANGVSGSYSIIL